MKSIDETKTYFFEEIEQNELMSKKHKKIFFDSKLYRTLSHFTFCGYWMFFSFCFCLFSWYSYWSYKFCTSSAGIKKYKSIIKKKKTKNDKIVLLEKTFKKAKCIKVLIYKTLTNSFIIHHEMLSLNNALWEYDAVKEKI